MPEEIKIVVKQESQGTALRDAERDAQRLQQTAQRGSNRPDSRQAASEQALRDQFASGDQAPDQPADDTKSHREDAALSRQIALSTELEASQQRLSGNTEEADKLEREAELLRRAASIQTALNVSADEAKTLAQAQIGAEEKIAATKAAQRVEEEAITRQKERQAAEAKLVADQRSAAIKSAVNSAGGAAGFGGLGDFLSLNPEAMLAKAGTTVLTKLVEGFVNTIDDKADSAAKTTYADHRRSQLASKTGISGQEGAASQFRDDKQALNEALAKRGTFHDTGIADRLWGAFGFETSAKRENRQNELEIARLQQALPKDEALSHEKFTNGPGGDELRAEERLASGDRRGARALRQRVEWEKELQQLVAAGTDLWQAQEGASLKIFNEEKQRRMDAAGHLVNARSGARDIARAASLAGSDKDISRDIKRAIEGLNHTVQVNHREAMNFRGPRKFNR